MNLQSSDLIVVLLAALIAAVSYLRNIRRALDGPPGDCPAEADAPCCLLNLGGNLLLGQPGADRTTWTLIPDIPEVTFSVRVGTGRVRIRRAGTLVQKECERGE